VGSASWDYRLGSCEPHACLAQPQQLVLCGAAVAVALALAVAVASWLLPLMLATMFFTATSAALAATCAVIVNCHKCSANCSHTMKETLKNIQV